jgi:hypothetical protein
LIFVINCDSLVILYRRFSFQLGGASANVVLWTIYEWFPMVNHLARPVGTGLPTCVTQSEDAAVSVSGIDISKNKKELLVSY